MDFIAPPSILPSLSFRRPLTLPSHPFTYRLLHFLSPSLSLLYLSHLFRRGIAPPSYPSHSSLNPASHPSEYCTSNTIPPNNKNNKNTNTNTNTSPHSPFPGQLPVYSQLYSQLLLLLSSSSYSPPPTIPANPSPPLHSTLKNQIPETHSIYNKQVRLFLAHAVAIPSPFSPHPRCIEMIYQTRYTIHA